MTLSDRARMDELNRLGLRPALQASVFRMIVSPDGWDGLEPGPPRHAVWPGKHRKRGRHRG